MDGGGTDRQRTDPDETATENRNTTKGGPTMPSATSPDGMSGPMDLALVESAWQRISGHLENEKQRIHEEIKTYPRPIPACDVQFNYLLEQRTGISRELDRMREVSEASLKGKDSIQLLEAFIRSSSHLDEEVKQRITFVLKEGLSRIPQPRAN